MRVWVADLKYHFAMALRAVGVGLVAVAWASVLASEGQQNADMRAYAVVVSAALSVVVVQWLTQLPPSRTLVSLLRPLERDMLFVARSLAPRDPERAHALVLQLAALAAMRVQAGANIPRDRRAWLRGLSRLTEADEAGDQLQV